MKSFFRLLFAPLVVGGSLLVGLPLPAQDTPPAAPTQDPAAAGATPASPAGNSSSTAPAADSPPPAPSAPATLATPDTPVAPETSAAPTTPEAPPSATSPAPAADDPAAKSTRDDGLRDLSEPPPAAKQSSEGEKGERPTRSFHAEGAVVRVGQDAHLADHEIADAVVAVFGSAHVEGEVEDAVVTVLGNTRITGPVGENVITIIGNVHINSRVDDDVVCVLGNVELGPKAHIGGELVAIGGNVVRDPSAVVVRGVNNVGFGSFFEGDWFSGLQEYFRRCVMLARPLAWSSTILWAWWIALGFLGFYVLIALLFPSGVVKSAQTLETRPGSSVLAAILSMVLLPILMTLLAFTVVGAPIVGVALFFIGVFGKVVMLAWLGRRITGLFGDGPLSHPAVAVMLGGAIALALYTVPVLGFIVYKLFGVLGVGVVIYTLILRSERPATAVAGVGVGAPGPVSAPAETPSAAGIVAAAAVEGGTTSFGAGATGVAAAAVPPMAVPVPASTLPRAGFWIRTAALLLDLILVGLIVALTSKLIPSSLRGEIGFSGILPLVAIYGAVMWKTKSTTIGGIVCGLKVIRVDGREMDWATAVVRALGCFLSLAVAGLGFIWVVIDDDKQSWHDKIAGTAVARVPKGVSLV